jgi:hypothetical protein
MTTTPDPEMDRALDALEGMVTTLLAFDGNRYRHYRVPYAVAACELLVQHRPERWQYVGDTGITRVSD